MLRELKSTIIMQQIWAISHDGPKQTFTVIQPAADAAYFWFMIIMLP